MPSDPITREKTALDVRWDGLGFDIRTSVRYHQRRVRFFDRWNATTNAVVLFSGSSAVMTLLTEWLTQKAAIVVFGGIVSVFALIDLVVGTARMARIHEVLYRQYIDLECQWTAIHEPTEIAFSDLESAKLRLEQGEPPPLITLVELCWNDTARSMGSDYRIVGIKRLQKMLANFWSFEDPSHQRKDLDKAVQIV
ncbi:MAG: hypothetical protein HQL87_15685 [Magnetococcales bacterium]|nr:hypothetical protein [Magnetococcales bacterium]